LQDRCNPSKRENRQNGNKESSQEGTREEGRQEDGEEEVTGNQQKATLKGGRCKAPPLVFLRKGYTQGRTTQGCSHDPSPLDCRALG
jgi:hypothetical protein